MTRRRRGCYLCCEWGIFQCWNGQLIQRVFTNKGASITLANYSAHMAAGSASTTWAQIKAFVVGAI